MLEQLQTELETKDISASYRKIKNEKIEQERVYMNLDKKFLTYFILYENKLFLKVYIARPQGFNFTGIKQSQDETDRCKKAKLKLLEFIKENAVTSFELEAYENWNTVNLSPKSSKAKLDL